MEKKPGEFRSPQELKHARIGVSIPRIYSHHALANSKRHYILAAGKTEMEVGRYVQHGKATRVVPVVYYEDLPSETGIWAE